MVPHQQERKEGVIDMSETKIAMKLEEESKPIKKMCEKLMDSVNHELDKGVENVDAKELGEVIDMIKDLYEAKKEMYEACYYKQIMEAMEEHDFEDEEEIMDEGRRGYRGQPRDSRGRYMRRGYDEMMYMPEMYRDMDRESMGKMYYTSANASQGSQGGSSGQSSGGSSTGSSSGGSMGYSDGMRGYSSQGRDSREGRSGQSRRSYMETKEMHKGNTQQDKDMKLKELDKYMNELSSDISEMIQDSSNEEKTMLKQKLNGLVQKIQ